MRTLRATAVHADGSWVVDVPEVGVRIHTQDLEAVDGLVQRALQRRGAGRGAVRVDIRVYLDASDAPRSRGRRSAC